ncbi:hypothetical protein DSC45_02605 [Streptomyces sp. YIM 130001]|uniref:hypothetical protein n=1 Tax=Streptomyces sp. YIM 130001 TaxID=2259644 RepID=UPI000E64639D|nr:hypothetical protein [Streptomyces sp. YIM 130001]RII20711.1 hypothetical protein DSC45_02605 [Streptomyces sp. YIM 130001]
MSKRHTMKARRALTAVAITTGLVLTVAGCGGGDGGDDKENSGKETSAPAKDGDKDKGSEEPAEDKVIAEVTGNEDIKLTINSAVRDGGGFVTVKGKVSNGGSDRWIANAWRGDETELRKNAFSMAGANLVDKAGKKKYLVLRDTNGRCLCTQFQGSFKQSEEREFFAQFPAPPDSATKVDFNIADMPPATIEISEGE